MAKEIYCKQCVLTREDGSSMIKLTTWVPEKLAVVGKLVTVDDGEEVWTVDLAGSMRVSQKDLKEREKVHRKYRQHTDI